MKEEMPDINKWLSSTYNKMEKKIISEVSRNKNIIPYYPINGNYWDKGTENVSWWTNGFWGGIMWQMYHATQNDIFKESAEALEIRLDEAILNFEGLHHDVGFMWLHTAVANYRLTGNMESRKRGLHVATTLAGRFNPMGKFIRSWNHNYTGWVIIDSMMNVPLLLWAEKETSDPRFGQIANMHIDTLLRTHIREDGSVNHIVDLDTHTGEVVSYPNGQGYSAYSSWSRGQAWALYGLVLNYQKTGIKQYLDKAKIIANYFLTNISTTGYIPLLDFRAPLETDVVDTSAAMIAACGLLELSKEVGDQEEKIYFQSALLILMNTENKYANWDVTTDGIIGGGAVAYNKPNEWDVKLIYSDYFFVEAILKLKKIGFDIW